MMVSHRLVFLAFLALLAACGPAANTESREGGDPPREPDVSVQPAVRQEVGTFTGRIEGRQLNGPLAGSALACPTRDGGGLYIKLKSDDKEFLGAFRAAEPEARSYDMAGGSADSVLATSFFSADDPARPAEAILSFRPRTGSIVIGRIEPDRMEGTVSFDALDFISSAPLEVEMTFNAARTGPVDRVQDCAPGIAQPVGAP